MRTLEETVVLLCTDLLMEECRVEGYVNKALLTERQVDTVILNVITRLFRGRDVNRKIVKADLMRRHIHPA